MTEVSRFWQGTAVGDASGQAPYDAPSEFSEAMAGYDGTIGRTNVGGVARGPNDFAATGVATPVTVAPGVGIVYGGWYKSDANIALAVATPISATRIDRIILRKAWTAQTIRMVLLAGVEGSGIPPALTQSAGTTWEFPLWQVSITTGGVITLLDERDYIGGLAYGPYVSSFGATAVITGTAIQHLKGVFNITMPPGGGRFLIVAEQAFDFTNITFHTDTDSFTVQVRVDGAEVYRIENQIIQEFTSVRQTFLMHGIIENIAAGAHTVDFYAFWANDTTAVATPVNDARWSRYSIMGIS